MLCFALHVSALSALFLLSCSHRTLPASYSNGLWLMLPTWNAWILNSELKLQSHHNAGITRFYFFLFSGRSFSILVEHALEDSSEKHENKISRDHSSSTDHSDHICFQFPDEYYKYKARPIAWLQKCLSKHSIQYSIKSWKGCLSYLYQPKSNFQFFETYFFYQTKEVSSSLTEEPNFSLQSKCPRILAI